MRENFIVHSNYQEFESQLKESLNNFSEIGVEVIKAERNTIKKVTIGDSVFNIKKFKDPDPFQALVYQYLRKSKAKRSYEYASKLGTMGIKTPKPVAFYERFAGGLKESYFVSEQLDYDLDFRVLNHNPKYPNREEILRQFTAFTYQLHENGVNFMDHSPGNTLIIEKERGQYDFYIIDLNRMRFEDMDFSERMKNFRRLWLSKTMIKIMASEYSNLYSKSYEETHALLTKFSRAFQKKVNSRKIRRRRKKAK